MLHIIYGEAGTGKSALMYEKIRKDAESGRKVFLFVPDQFSFEAEKIICRSVPSPAAGNVTVTMFSRAAAKLLHLYGETKEYADDAAKLLLMTRVLNTLASGGRLLYYQRQVKKPGFPKFALEIVSRLRSEGITPSALKTLAADSGDSISGMLLNKLNDICEIYSEYDELLRASFDDRLDDVRRASELIPLSKEFEGAGCYFDGFDIYSGSRFAFIGALLKKAADVTFTATTDSPNTKKRHFYCEAKLIAKLKQLNGGEAELIQMTEKHRAGCTGMIIKARDPWQECDWICAQIRALMDEGYRCREIAVLTPKPVYAEILGSAMKKYEIPFFADIPEPLLYKSVVRFAIDTLRALSFETEDLLRYIKSGFVRHGDGEGQTISNLQVDTLERICRRYDVRKRDWLKPFPEKMEDAVIAEQLRISVVEPLRKLKRAFDNAKDGAEMTEALCAFLFDDMDINKTIYRMCIVGDGSSQADRKKLDAYSSLWDDTVKVFEAAHEALRGYSLTLSEYIEIVSGIFASETVAKPPQVLDAVTVGDVERSRFRKVRAVFLCGFSQGVFPRAASASAAFSGSETQLLIDCGIALGEDRETRYSSELFQLYRCVNLPEERLFVTFPALSDTFSELQPSSYLDDLKKRFGTDVKGADDFEAAFWCRTEQSARRFLAGIYCDPARSAERAEILKALGEKELFGENDAPDRHRISERHAALLLSPETYSPTAINSMNNCKFAYFCNYGLSLRDTEERGVNAMLSGSVVHYCLEKILSEHTKDEITAMSDADIRGMMRENVRKYRDEVFFGDFGAADRFSYQLAKLSELAAKALERVRDGLKVSSFVPEALERQIEFRFGDIVIKGVCDRLDVSKEEGKTYLRVVDYKRGKKELPLDSVYRGENLQMLLYLFGLCEEYGAEPSSVLYQPIGADDLTQDSGDDRTAGAAAQKQKNERLHTAGGLVLEQSPERSEADALNEYYSEMYGETDKGYASPRYISKAGFDSLREYCRAYVNALALQTRKGMASACPLKEESCAYCDYGLFCGRERKNDEE